MAKRKQIWSNEHYTENKEQHEPHNKRSELTRSRKSVLIITIWTDKILSLKHEIKNK
jgi:hypothetical protein